MMKRIFALMVAVMSVSCLPSMAQKVSLSTNILGYACIGTLNAEASVFVSQKWSLTAGFKYNPFTIGKGDPQRQLQLRQQSYSLGMRMWPWHTGSGWWLAAKARYQEYNMGGLLSRETREGDRFGAGFYAGYTHMISPHFNLEFGAGLWGGLDIYRRYTCPVCGPVIDSGRKGFLLPDDIMLSIVYVF